MNFQDLKLSLLLPFYGFTDFLPVHELKNPDTGFILNDTCMIEVGIFMNNYV